MKKGRGDSAKEIRSILVSSSRSSPKNENGRDNPIIKLSRNPTDWVARDFALSNELIAAKSEVIAEFGKPRKNNEISLTKEGY